jgi:ribonuclease HII
MAWDAKSEPVWGAKPDFNLEAGLMEAGLEGPICGVDEAGRGPWAGPVLAAAVILDPRALPFGVDDSKKLNPEKREELAAIIRATAHIGLGAASACEIDRINVHNATLLAMARAVGALKVRPRLALIDGRHMPRLAMPAKAIVDGDARSLSIAAASIIAKVARDHLMRRLGRQYPGYGWERNKGYGTPEHERALIRLGPSPHHRLSFAPVRAARTQDVVLSY